MMSRGMILDEGYSWVIFAASFVNIFISLGIPFSMGVYNVEYLDYFGESKAATGWILSINLGLLLGAGPIAAWLMIRFSERAVACGGSLLCTVGTVSMYFCQNIYHLYVAYGLIAGFGYCMVYLPSAVIVGHYFQKYRSATTAVCSAGSGLALLIMPFFYNVMIEKYTWRGSVLILAGCNLQTLVFSALLRPQKEALLNQNVAIEKQKTTPVNESKAENVHCEEGAETEKCLPGLGENCDNASGICPEKDLHVQFMTGKISNDNESASAQCETVTLKTDHTWNDESKVEQMIDDGRNINSTSENENGIATENYGLLGDAPESALRDLPISVSPSDSVSEEIEVATVVADCKENIHVSAKTSNNDGRTKSSKCKDINRHYNEETKGHAMLDFNFFVYFVSNIFWNIGTGILAIIPPDYLYENGTSKSTANYVITFGGAGSVIGGAVAGLIGNHPRCNRLLLYIAANIIAGITGFLFLISSDFILVTVVNTLFGMSMGAIVGLLVVLCADIIGMAKLGQAYGYLMLSNGAGNLVGLPLAGWLFDLSGNYRSSFALAGVLNFLGGIVMFVILVHKRRKD